MFPKKKRVTKELFQAIMKHGKVLSSPLFVFRYIEEGEPHYAFVAPKSVAKGATARNSLRRRGYAQLRPFPLKSGAGIFFYKKGSLKADNAEITESIRKLLTTSHLSS